MHAIDELARWLAAERLPDQRVTLPSGTAVDVPRLLRHETRTIEPVLKTSSCWAPNKPALAYEGQSTFAEFILVELLVRHGWEARWIKNWTSGREFCRSVGQPQAMPKAAAATFARIDRRAASTTGGGAWDIWAWRGDDYLFLESKQHRSGDTLRPGQIAWLEAAVDEGVMRFAIVEYSAPRISELRLSDAEAPSRTRATRSTRTPETIVDDLPAGLAQLLDDANVATPSTRIEFRTPIAAFGADAVPPLTAWVRAGTHPGFAVGTLERIARDGHGEALASLKRLKPLTTGTVRSDIEDALHRIGPTTWPRLAVESG